MLSCLVVFGCMLLLLLLIDISQEQGLPRISKGQTILHLLSSPPPPNAVDSHCMLTPPSPSQLFCASTFLSTLPSPSNICFLHPCSCAQECLWQKPVTRMAFPTRNLFSPLLVLSQQNTSPNTSKFLDCSPLWLQLRSSLPLSTTLSLHKTVSVSQKRLDRGWLDLPLICLPLCLPPLSPRSLPFSLYSRCISFSSVFLQSAPDLLWFLLPNFSCRPLLHSFIFLFFKYSFL